MPFNLWRRSHTSAGLEVIVLTKRPETVGAIAQVQSQRWLEARGFTLPSVYVVQGSRGRIAASLGLDIVGDCLDILTQVDSAEAREQPGVMNRVMRLLGLKEPADA